MLSSSPPTPKISFIHILVLLALSVEGSQALGLGLWDLCAWPGPAEAIDSWGSGTWTLSPFSPKLLPKLPPHSFFCLFIFYLFVVLEPKVLPLLNMYSTTVFYISSPLFLE